MWAPLAAPRAEWEEADLTDAGITTHFLRAYVILGWLYYTVGSMQPNAS
jgi:hypothetical protein